MNIDNNIPNQNVAPVEQQSNSILEANNLDAERLRKEQDIGEHDIVIDEDFQIDIAVSDVSPFDANNALNQKENQEPEQEIGTEQTGNITF